MDEDKTEGDGVKTYQSMEATQMEIAEDEDSEKSKYCGVCFVAFTDEDDCVQCQSDDITLPHVGCRYWFHYGCVNFNPKFQGSWLCRNCRSKWPQEFGRIVL